MIGVAALWAAIWSLLKGEGTIKNQIHSHAAVFNELLDGETPESLLLLAEAFTRGVKDVVDRKIFASLDSLGDEAFLIGIKFNRHRESLLLHSYCKAILQVVVQPMRSLPAHTSL